MLTLSEQFDNSEEFFLWRYHLLRSFATAHLCKIKPEHLCCLLCFVVIELILIKQKSLFRWGRLDAFQKAPVCALQDSQAKDR